MLKKLVRQYLDYTTPVPLRVAMGTYNINGGKHFRSIVFKDVSLSDWLLDAHKSGKTHGKIIQPGLSGRVRQGGPGPFQFSDPQTKVRCQ